MTSPGGFGQRTIPTGGATTLRSRSVIVSARPLPDPRDRMAVDVSNPRQECRHKPRNISHRTCRQTIWLPVETRDSSREESLGGSTRSLAIHLRMRTRPFATSDATQGEPLTRRYGLSL